ncbi:MAG: MlaD family protein [Gammaproteobacteria bacterium]
MGRNKHALVTGVFLIVLIAATTAAIYWIGHFERERNIYVVSTKASVSGLNPESTVFYRGIAVGKVISIGFDPHDSGIILITIEVDKNIVLTKGVYATLQLKGVTGLTQLQLEDSGTIPERLPPGDNPMARIPLVPSLTDKLMVSGEELLKKADNLMQRLNSLLSDENEKNIGDILANLKILSEKLTQLQQGVDKAIAGIPALTDDASKTLSHIDVLAAELQTLTRHVQSLSIKAGGLVDSSKNTGDFLVESTLPKMNELLTDLQTTAQEVKKVANMLESNPQALLFGHGPEEPGPGEPGFKEPK